VQAGDRSAVRKNGGYNDDTPSNYHSGNFERGIWCCICWQAWLEPSGR
jgi:hypothetical protein